MMVRGFKLFTGLLLVNIFCRDFVSAVKLILASEKDCDRYSLDALYREKYSRETEKALADITEFVNRTTDLMVDSVIKVMADLPGRESSDAEERKVFMAFSEMKKKFARKVNKLLSNITSSWESLVQANHNLMLDNGKFTLNDVLIGTKNVAEAYTSSRSALDNSLRSVISTLKEIIRSSIQGISTVAENEIKKEKLAKSNKTSEMTDDEKSSAEVENSSNETLESGDEAPNSEEVLKEKKKEIVKLLAPQFLGIVSVIIIDNNVDLEKKITLKSEERDSVLDDMCFALIMIRSRVNAIIHKDASRNKEARDLARRSLYIYFADTATDMYQDRLKEREAPSGESNENRQMWKDENHLAETLVNLMEQYP